MVRVVITGLGLRCALGDRHQAWQKLQRGESAIQLRQPFRDLPVIPVAMLGKEPIDLEILRRSLVEATLVDAGLEPPLEHCGIVIGSSRGFQGQWEKAAVRRPTRTSEGIRELVNLFTQPIGDRHGPASRLPRASFSTDGGLYHRIMGDRPGL